jgi:hypothetical protein
MKIDIRNSEGYVDPTPFQALTKIQKEEAPAPVRRYMICSPQVGHRNIKPTWGYFYVQKK